MLDLYSGMNIIIQVTYIRALFDGEMRSDVPIAGFCSHVYRMFIVSSDVTYVGT